MQFTDEGYRLVRCAIGDGAVPFPELVAMLAEHQPSLTAVLEPGALEARHVRLFTPDWWNGYAPKTAAELSACLRAARVNRLPAEADYRTPWERATTATLERYELDMIRRSAANMRALGIMERMKDGRGTQRQDRLRHRIGPRPRPGDGRARRVRGGAVSLLMRGEELPFAMREMSAAAAKQRIGTAAAGSIADGEAVGLDGGTTVLETARALRGRRLTVLPVSLHAAMALADSSSVRLLMPGGEVRPGELSVVGPSTLAAIAALRLDTVVLACCGISPDGQVTTHDVGDAAVKQALIGCARRSVLVLDGSKFTHSAMAVVCDATSLDVVVTDDTAPAEAIASLETAGTVVHRV